MEISDICHSDEENESSLLEFIWRPLIIRKTCFTDVSYQYQVKLSGREIASTYWNMSEKDVWYWSLHINTLFFRTYQNGEQLVWPLEMECSLPVMPAWKEMSLPGKMFFRCIRWRRPCKCISWNRKSSDESGCTDFFSVWIDKYDKCKSRSEKQQHIRKVNQDL